MRALFYFVALLPIAANLTAQSIFTVAGGRHLEGRPATSIPLASPGGVAADRNGVVYIADTEDQRIRRLAVDGTMTTFAGNGESGFSGDGGPAVAAELWRPYGVAVDSKGQVYVLNGQVFVYDPSGRLLGRIDVPERPIGLAFGGADRQTLFILTRHTLYAMKTRGKQ